LVADCQSGNLRERQNHMRRPAALWMTARSTVVLLSLTSWFLLSNHCALAMISSPREAAPEVGGCPMHSAPAKKKPAPQTPCCNEVRAVIAKCLAKAMALSLRFATPCDYAAEIFGFPPRVSLEIDGFDTGPPSCFSFAELVLQKSMLAHAPPVS
jgi:hypothetical protein